MKQSTILERVKYLGKPTSIDYKNKASRQYDEYINACLDTLRQSMTRDFKESERTFTPDEIIAITSKHINFTRDQLIDQSTGSKKSMVDLTNRVGFLEDERSKESWAHSVDQIKYLCYRIATAIGIAIVILMTGLAAKTWEIPLPLLRIAT